MIVVDASVWVGIVIATDTFHVPSRAWVRSQEATGDGFAVPTIVFPEVTGSVARQTRDIARADAAGRFIATMATLTVVVVDEALADLAARLAADLGLRGADAVYVATAVHPSCPLVTWDAEMLRKTRDTIEARQPTS